MSKSLLKLVDELLERVQSKKTVEIQFFDATTNEILKKIAQAGEKSKKKPDVIYRMYI